MNKSEITVISLNNPARFEKAVSLATNERRKTVSTRRMRSDLIPVVLSSRGVLRGTYRMATLGSSRPVPTVALVSTAISHVPRASSIPNKTRIKGGERGADGGTEKELERGRGRIE